MTMSKAFILLIFLTLLADSTFAGSNQCAFLFFKQPKTVKVGSKTSNLFFKAAFGDLNSTTGNRAETKQTLAGDKFKIIFSDFEKQIRYANTTLSLRDTKTEGLRNVTWTSYSNRFKLVDDYGKTVSAKIRVRKYGTVENFLPVLKKNFTPIERMKNISGFEFKVQNPDFDFSFNGLNFKSVGKGIVLIHDIDAQLLLNPKLSEKEKGEIFLRTLEINKQSDGSIDPMKFQTLHFMLNAISRLHRKDLEFKPSFETIYERDSFKLEFRSKNYDKPFEIQITIDKDIDTRYVESNIVSNAYQTIEPAVVVETKIPTQIINEVFNPDQSGSPEVSRALIDFLNRLEFNSLKSFESGKGKLFHTRRN
jgi:hypothetical protein